MNSIFRRSFFWAMLATLFSLGTVLTPWFTLSARLVGDEISLRSECVFVGPQWDCLKVRGKTSAVDPGATSAQEIPGHIFLHSEGAPKWNPYIGSGYPVFLDGMSRPTSPYRALLTRFPTDGTRDLVIFVRIFLWTWGILFCLVAWGVSGWYLFFIGFAATLLPFPSRFLDIVFLDIDLMAPWAFAILIWRERASSRSRFIDWPGVLAFGALGAWIGAQSFVQSQIVFASVIALLCVIAFWRWGARAVPFGLAFFIPFAALSLPNALQFKARFAELASNREFLGCIASSGWGWGELFRQSYRGFGHSIDWNSVCTIGAVPFLVWGAWRLKESRPFAAMLAVLVYLLAAGMPSAICSIDGLKATGFSRHFLAHAQSLAYILLAIAIYQATALARRRTLWRFMGVGIAIYPGVMKDWVVKRHLQGEYPRAVEFAYDKIPTSNVFQGVQEHAQKEDRRHYSPDGRLAPNYSAIFRIPDMRVLYGVFPRRVFALNRALVKNWYGSSPGLPPDRFVGEVLGEKMISTDMEKLLILHRVSMLSFAKGEGWLERNSFYNRDRCLPQGEDQLAVFYLCPSVGGIGFFPRAVRRVSATAEAIEVLRGKSAIELIDFAVLETEGPAPAAEGKVISVERTANTLTYNLEVSRPGYFVVADAFFRGWRADVNGERKEIIPANVAFKAIEVKEGRQKLSLEFSDKME